MYSYNLQHDASYISNFFGTDGGTKSDEFSEKFQSFKMNWVNLITYLMLQ